MKNPIQETHKICAQNTREKKHKRLDKGVFLGFRSLQRPEGMEFCLRKRGEFSDLVVRTPDLTVA
jgi:hypothetical protein